MDQSCLNVKETGLIAAFTYARACYLKFARQNKSPVRSILIFILAILLQQCAPPQDKQPGDNSENNLIAHNSASMDSMQKKSGLTKEGNPFYSRDDTSKVDLKEEEWEKILPAELYHIARQKGTERPGTSIFENFNEHGTYYCAACGNALFKSDTKFESGCGWPSFYEPISKTSIINTVDQSHGMTRTEVQCGRCKAHLGHVFNDGPPPTGLRYCINGVILDFEKAKDTEKKYIEGNQGKPVE